MRRKVLIVLTVQAAVVAIASGFAAGAVAITGNADTLFPEILRLPLTPSRPDASAPQAADALRRAFPHEHVSMDDDEIVITFLTQERDVAPARAALAREGFESGRFTIGRDFRPVPFARRLLTAFSSFALIIVSFPLILLAAAVRLRRRLPAQARRTPSKSVAAVVLAGVAGGLALALASELLGRLVKALGYPIVEQPWIEA